jgi:hypothetical protein
MLAMLTPARVSQARVAASLRPCSVETAIVLPAKSRGARSGDAFATHSIAVGVAVANSDPAANIVIGTPSSTAAPIPTTS